ncbi:MAG: hypothetical protein HGA54_04925 [Actinobacteria bacterium]|nr:hypothetical protein [Actinomycetota bacterium]
MNCITLTDLYGKAFTFHLDSRSHSVRGNLFAQVLCVKGESPSHEVPSGDLCTLEERAALRKAFVALGYEDEDFLLVRSGGELLPEDLLEVIEVIDPLVVVALDENAAHDVCSAFGISFPKYGVLHPQCKRRFVAVDGFEASLKSESMKRVSWNQLKAAGRTKEFA